MELVLSPGRLGGETNTGSPFHNQEIREWSHVDRLTGMLEHARVETGRWEARHQGTAQAYGKVIDSRERNSADGNVVQKARRQVEVFQSQGVGGRSVQVVRASQWSSSRITDSSSSSPVSVSMNDVSQLRNGNDDKSVNGRLSSDESLAKLSQVSRLCRQINGETIQKKLLNEQTQRSPVFGNRLKSKFDGFNAISKDERKKINSSSLIMNSLKSTSNEDLTKSIYDPKTKSQTVFNRDCKARRSLQIPKSVVTTDFDGNRNNEIRVNPEGMEFTERNNSSRNSPSSDHDISVLKNDRKRVKSYVLGMEEADSEAISSSLSLPKPIIHEKKILFNGTVVDENGKDNIIKSEYLRPTPILLKPKSNTTVVHLNNKLSIESEKIPSAENDTIKCLLENETTLRSISSSSTTSRVQSLANRFSNGNNFKSINGKLDSFSQNSATFLGNKQSMIDSSSSRIEGLINRSAVLNGVDNSIEIFPALVEKKIIEDPSVGTTLQVKPVKRVGFCKTEVHFAAESGKVNIVETDCKPPPSNRFRRRRRNSIAMNTPISQNKNLPLIHFGDTSYEKYIFGQSNGSFKPDDFNAKDKLESENNSGETDSIISLRDKILDQKLTTSDELNVRDGWRARLKTIMKSEPPTIMTADDENDDVTILNTGKKFDVIEETIVDHSFKGSHTTTVNLGANVISKTHQKHTNEGKCNTISTGIQLQFNTRLEKLTPINGTEIEVAKNNQAKNAINTDKNHPPYSIVVSTVSKIPRPLIQTQQSVLKSTHLVMNLNRIKNFNSIVNNTDSNNAFKINNEKNDNSMTLKHLISSLNDNCTSGMVIRGRDNSDVDIVNNNYPKNCTSTLITMNANNCSSMNYKNNITNSNTYPIRFTPVRLKHLNDRLNQSEDRKRIDDPNDGRENQLQYSSGSEQADEEVRSYMLGSKIHHSYTQHKKFTHSRSVKMEESTKSVHKAKEEHSGSIMVKENRKNDDFIDNINENEMIDDVELDNIVNSGLPEEEVCFEANRTVEKSNIKENMTSDSNVVTSDNENNKVLMNIVTTHEPVIARVEDNHSPNTRRELFSRKKLRSHSVTQSEQKLKISRETDRSINKSFSSISPKKMIIKQNAKDHQCDNKSGKDLEPRILNDADVNAVDPTYVNVFENFKKSVPIYENYRITRKNNINDKKYTKNVIQPELNVVTDDPAKSTNGNSDVDKILSNTDCDDENFKQYNKSSDPDAKLASISESNSSERNNRESHKIKTSKTRSKRIVRPPSSTSSIESLHRSSANETAKDSEAKPMHAKSTRSSRLHRVTSNHETSGQDTVERYTSINDKKKITSERITTGKLLTRSNNAASVVDANTATKSDQGSKNLNDSTRSKKPIEIVYQTAVFNMKNEKLAKSSKSKESKTPRYINDLICGSRPKRGSTDVRHVKGTSLSQQRTHHKSTSPTNRHWK